MVARDLSKLMIEQTNLRVESANVDRSRVDVFTTGSAEAE
jgi:hypothetical protein